MSPFVSIEEAIEELRQGRMLILVDTDREQEGDLMIAADKATPAAINFMTKYARGLICLTLTENRLEHLQIPLMPERNRHLNQAAFAISIDAAQGITSGTSTHDRAHTIKVAISSQSTPEDISMPGHVFPLKACQGGVLTRPGHTEASIDLAKLAGFTSAGVLCEIMKDDGSMARLADLILFGEQHQIKLVAINDLIAYQHAHHHNSKIHS